MITSEEINRFYVAHGVIAACPVCGQNNWSLVESPKDMSFSLHSQPTTGGMIIGGGTSIPMAVMVCNNCFSLRFHAEKGIRNWLDQPTSVETSTEE